MILLERIAVDNVCQRASLHVLHDDPKLSALDEERVEEVDNVGMLALLHDEDLVDDELLPRLLAQVHLLDRDFRSVGEDACDVDGS